MVPAETTEKSPSWFLTRGYGRGGNSWNTGLQIFQALNSLIKRLESVNKSFQAPNRQQFNLIMWTPSCLTLKASSSPAHELWRARDDGRAEDRNK